MATASTIWLVAVTWFTGAPISRHSFDVMASSMALSWACLGAYWLISRPTREALNWAWNSYNRAVEQTSVARVRQAELVRTAKSLTESYYRVEQLNLELEQARRAAQDARRQKAQFAAAVSHELRTPLNLIIGFCELMVHTPSSSYGRHLPANYQGDLEAIYRNAGHIATLVDDILDLSQIDADRMALHREWVSVNYVVDEAVATVRNLFEERGLFLRVESSKSLAVFADQTRVRQILINLLGNAARFTEEGGVTVHIGAPANTVVVSVQDTGPGIPPGELPDVFEEFYQVGGSPRHGGSGLGLTVSKRFAELHGGTMWVASALGVGTTFFLQLPTIVDSSNENEDAVAWGDRVGRRVRGEVDRSILVIDEGGQAHKVFQRYLDGYRVLHATSIGRARRLARGEPIQAIVLGSHTAAVAWDSAPPSDLAQRPVIRCVFRTAHSAGDTLGVANYLVKPVSRDQLRAALRRLERPIRRVLVVDDDTEMQRLLTRMLRTLIRDGDVHVASNGEEALASLRLERPDVVLLDLLMPKVNGYGFLDAIRAELELHDLPVLVITARGNADESVVADSLAVTRLGGLSVAEVMRWVGSSLNSLAPRGAEPTGIAPGLPEGSPD